MTNINTAHKTPKERKSEALQASFYFDHDSDTLYRVLYAEDVFGILDEDTLEEKAIPYSEIHPANYFLKAVKVLLSPSVNQIN